MNSRVNRNDLKNMAVWGASKFSQGVVAPDDWGRAMVEAFGDDVKPHLNDLYYAALNFHRQHFGHDPAGYTPPELFPSTSDELEPVPDKQDVPTPLLIPDNALIADILLPTPVVTASSKPIQDVPIPESFTTTERTNEIHDGVPLIRELLTISGIIRMIAALLLGIAVIRVMPYDYYALLKWTAAFGCVLALIPAYDARRFGWSLLFGLGAFVLGPLTPFHFQRQTWAYADAIGAAMLVYSLLFSVQGRKTPTLVIKICAVCVAAILTYTAFHSPRSSSRYRGMGWPAAIRHLLNLR